MRSPAVLRGHLRAPSDRRTLTAIFNALLLPWEGDRHAVVTGATTSPPDQRREVRRWHRRLRNTVTCEGVREKSPNSQHEHTECKKRGRVFDPKFLTSPSA